MEEIISLGNIQVHQNAADWQQAIRIAGEPLIRGKSVKPEQIESMIRSVIDMGPYIVLMPYFALAHAAPSKNVLKDDMSIAVFDNDIYFGSDNDPVRVVMCLACTDGKKHVEKLSKIAKKLMDSDADLLNRLMKAESREEIFELLNK
ncbi:MAG: PTS sugar transporter subunit IIA [Erysipelotrichia bacterium]|nr:PTS sugar transporter subunit IIA [Erysipelotrichia bacterium]